ncbi:MAG: redoxin [Bacteroidetes bacterium MedPE-SWsnd-G2]|nr:MAG: redoxin [Bacteroidetes bacterium MedPE-SWsnd-G2]
MRLLFTFIIGLILMSCQNEKQDYSPVGVYLGELKVLDDEILPFNFEVLSDSTVVFTNAEEKISTSEVLFLKDSVTIKLPVFEAYIKAKINADKWEGEYVKESLDRIVEFTAIQGVKDRFTVKSNGNRADVSGVWETTFSPDVEEDSYVAKGVFKQEGNKVTGTFMTETGDYRFLEGVVDGQELKLSTFDGAHAFFFKAKLTDSIMDGMFYSGNHYKEPFIAKRNERFELTDANDLTYLKEGYESFEFNFPDVNGKMLSLNDQRFEGKPVLVQIMGTWCPNCLDESKFYSKFYNAQQNKDVEIVALAFEYAKTEASAVKAINRLQNGVGMEYPVLLAQYGTSSKSKANEKLPMLNHVLSYPTTIYLDKNHEVYKIHTGFNGPATGEAFEAFKKEFSKTITTLTQSVN